MMQFTNTFTWRLALCYFWWSLSFEYWIATKSETRPSSAILFAHAETIEVDWFIPENPAGLPPRRAEVGDTIRFSWSQDFHTVFIHPSGNCMDRVGKVRVGTKSPASYNFTEADVGTVFFACQAANYCLRGQHVTVRVGGNDTSAIDNDFSGTNVTNDGPTGEDASEVPGSIGGANCTNSTEIFKDEIVSGILPTAPSRSPFTNSTDLTITTGMVNNIFELRQGRVSPVCSVPPAATRGGGVWFSFVGTGNSVRASTCSAQTSVATSILAFQGTCPSHDAEDEPDCLVGDHGTQRCDVSVGAATVTWHSETGTTYYIWVTSHEIPSGQVVDPASVRTFELMVTEFELVANHGCPTGTMIELSNNPQALVATGSTYDATRDFEYGDECGPPLDYPGTWHQVVGTGEAITVSACTNVTEYHAAVSIFEGPCDGLKCVAGMDFSVNICEFGAAGTVTWFAASGTTYHVYVHGAGSFISSVGSYGLTAFASPVEEANDFCQQATPLTANEKNISGSTSSATRDTFGVTYCGVPILSPGLWYEIEGDGDVIQATTCSEGSNFTGALSVFSGTCHNPECVTGKAFSATCGKDGAMELQAPLRRRHLQSSNATILADAVSFPSEVGKTYYLLVHGDTLPDDISSDSFELDINSVPASTFVCQETINQFHEEEGLLCNCTDGTNGELTLVCTSACQSCNENATVCGEEELQATVGADGRYLFIGQSFHYVVGRNETLLVGNDEVNESCYVTVDDNVTCNSCEIVTCSDGITGVSIDCTNYEANATFVDCDDGTPQSHIVGTILEGFFGFEDCEPANTTSAPTKSPIARPAPTPDSSSNRNSAALYSLLTLPALLSAALA